MSRSDLIVGVDIGGTKTLVALATAEGRVIRRCRMPTPARQKPEVLLEAMRQAVEEVRGDTSLDNVSAVGVGVPGPYDSRRQVLTSSPHLPEWHNVPLRKLLRQRLGRPTFVDNDANAAALGEHRFGAGIGTSHMVYITVSTGIGGGVIIDGKLYVGASGAAGEVGHMTIDVNGPRCSCGNFGCWESLASGTALALEAVARLHSRNDSRILKLAGGDLSKVKAEVIFEAYQQGDVLAASLIQRTAYYLGVGLGNLINIFSPEMIVVGGGLSNMGDVLLGPAEAVARERAFAISASAARIVRARLGDDVGVLGAVALAAQGLGDSQG